MNTSYPDVRSTLLALAPGRENAIVVHKAFVDFTGSLEAGMMLGQLLYWTPRAKLPDGFVAKSYADWTDELCLTQYAVRKARKTLEEMGILETKKEKFAGAPTIHYRLVMDEVNRKWICWIQQIESANSPNGSVETNKTSTETTPETTLETTPCSTPAKPEQATHDLVEIAKVYTVSQIKALADDLSDSEWEALYQIEKANKNRVTALRFMRQRLSSDRPPSVDVYRDVSERFPKKSLWGEIDDVVGRDEDALDLWRAVVKGYIMKGWNPRNLANMLDFFRRGEVPGQVPTRTGRGNGGSRQKEGSIQPGESYQSLVERGAIKERSPEEIDALRERLKKRKAAQSA